MSWLSLVLAAVIIALGFWRQVRQCRRRGLALRGNVFSSRSSLAVYLILNVLTVATLIRSLVMGNFEHVFHCLLALFLYAMPMTLSRNLKVELPNALTIIVFLFIYAAWILGEINNFYGNIPGWDTMLHTLNGFLCAAIGFALVDILNRNERVSMSLSPGYLALVAFCFSMTVGVLWEFVEFGVDTFTGLDMQKDYFVHAISSIELNPTGENVPVAINGIVSTTLTLADGSTYTMSQGYLDIGLLDTMKDLLVNFVGAVVFSVIGYFYVLHKGGGIAEHFIPIVRGLRDDPGHDEPSGANAAGKPAAGDGPGAGEGPGRRG